MSGVQPNEVLYAQDRRTDYWQDMKPSYVLAKTYKSKSLQNQVISNLQDFIACLPLCFCTCNSCTLCKLAHDWKLLCMFLLDKNLCIVQHSCIFTDVCGTIGTLYWSCVCSKSNSDSASSLHSVYGKSKSLLNAIFCISISKLLPALPCLATIASIIPDVSPWLLLCNGITAVSAVIAFIASMTIIASAFVNFNFLCLTELLPDLLPKHHLSLSLYLLLPLHLFPLHRLNLKCRSHLLCPLAANLLISCSFIIQARE